MDARAIARLAVAIVIGGATVCGGGVRAQEFIDLPWREVDGRLEVQLLDYSAGATELQFRQWEAMFPGLLDSAAAPMDWLGDAGQLGVFVYLPLIVHGYGGAAAIEDAEVRLKKLGIRTTAGPWNLGLKDTEFVSLLRMRCLADMETRSAAYVLRMVAMDEGRDVFVRALALASLCERPREKMDSADLPTRARSSEAFRRGISRIPDGCSLAVGIEAAALPRLGGLMGAWRDHQLARLGDIVLAGGGSIGPAEMARGQKWMDQPGQLPYELAKRLGNWRVDYVMMAAYGRSQTQWWLHLSGAFAPESVAAGVRRSGGVVTQEGEGHLAAALCGWRLEVTDKTLEAWEDGMQVGSRGDSSGLREEQESLLKCPAWLWMPADSRLGPQLGLEGCEVSAQLQPALAEVTGVVTCEDASAAARLVDRWRGWCESHLSGEASEAHGNPQKKGEGAQWVVVRGRLLGATRVSQYGKQIRLTMPVEGLSLRDVVRLLAKSPGELLAGP